MTFKMPPLSTQSSAGGGGRGEELKQQTPVRSAPEVGREEKGARGVSEADTRWVLDGKYNSKHVSDGLFKRKSRAASAKPSRQQPRRVKPLPDRAA